MIINALLASLLSVITNDDVVLLDKGLRMMGLVSNASISIVTLTFSLTVLSVQIAAQSYSPRLLDEFLKDPVSKVVISTNLGAYVYCYTINYFLDNASEDPRVPYVSIHLLTMHIAIVLVSFVNFIHFFINGFRLEKILSRAEQGALAAARALNDEIDTDVGLVDLPEVPKRAFKVLADCSGYVTQYKLRNLLKLATKMDVCVRYNHQIGEYVNRGTVLAYVWEINTPVDTAPKNGDDLEKNGTPAKATLKDRVIENIAVDEEELAGKTLDKRVEKRLGLFVSQGISIESKRNSDLDLSLGIQQLADIAVRALSPGVNDPFTAIQCMDVLTSLLATLAIMDLAIPAIKDENGHLRACAPRRTFSYMLSMLDGIRVYGSEDLGVCRRALRMLGDLASILTRSRRLDRIPACLAQLEEWMKVSRNTFAEGSNELTVLEELNGHILRDIAESENVKVKDGDTVKDLQHFETTYNEENAGGDDDGKTNRMVLDFLKNVAFSSS